ncbi:MAG: hypothetical protein K6T83_24165, partial [Alicyclobacillus sp.]|nr:hypothetical protein [Alicyclobacillus sp.]
GLKPTWRSAPHEVGGGMFADTGSHFVDAALWLAAAGSVAGEADSEMSHGADPLEVQTLLEPAGSAVETHMNVQIRLRNGVLVSLTANARTHGLTARSSGSFTVLGDEGWVLCDMREAWLVREGVKTPILAIGADISPVEAFAAAVLDGAPNPCPAEEAARAVIVTEAAYASAASGNTLRIE